MVLCLVACSSSPSGETTVPNHGQTKVDENTIENHEKTFEYSSLDKEYQVELKESPWHSCLDTLLKDPLQRDIRVQDPQLSRQCSNLLTRASTTPRPRLLSREWVILDAKEYLRPALKLDSIKQGFKRAQRSFHQGTWRLSIVLLRLPPDSSHVSSHRKSTLDIKGTPPPLSHWSNGVIERALVSEWGLFGLESHELTKLHQVKLSELPSPRVGQSIYLEISRPAPQITRGGWALHLPLRFSSPALKYTLEINTPKGASISHFGVSPSHIRQLSHETQREWTLTSIPSHFGGEIYLTTTSTWETLHQWLWRSFSQARESYRRFVNQHLDDSVLSFFLSSRSPRSVHQWIRRYLHYTPRPYRPYTPLPIRELLQNREGDCKDFSLLSQTLLSTQGHRSFIAFASTKALPKAAFETPSIGWFDHVLLWLPSDNALRLATLASKTFPPLLVPGLTSYEWFDATSSRTKTSKRGQAELKGQYAYVMLSEEHGVWVPFKPH